MAFISSGYDPKEPMKNRITDIGPRNAASTATLQKLGFVQTHSAKRTYFIGVVSSDSDYYALQRP